MRDKAKVLIVDDDELIRDLSVMVLAWEGFEVVTASNGRDGLDVAKFARPDCILLDMVMPVMGGKEFMRRYRGDARVIAFSAGAMRDVVADAYLPKPFDINDLVDVVRRNIPVAA